eukprot:Plantae.Rhodophyta-Hildenbrandia_rubra.ctg3797.p1 GENE.Plantae.Rhodophyta-Hildenbrandia_rubra.ctg3797~~Plantae.Rhodophyta-Hildenbrandia_rubra.ctg3797.p1  ORF type:complete len:332 (-),score=38.95 Plantae.Rhodophyta-Hildenbrandia_rubra.ctg3797:397-1392(-)
MNSLLQLLQAQDVPNIRSVEELEDRYHRLLRLVGDETAPPLTLRKAATKVIDSFEIVCRELQTLFSKNSLGQQSFTSGFLRNVRMYGPKPTALVHRAHAYLQLQEYEKARRNAEEAIRIYEDPSCVKDNTIFKIYGHAFCVKGLACRGLGHLMEAFDGLYQACAILRRVPVEGNGTGVLFELYRVLGMLSKDKPRHHYTQEEITEISCTLKIHDYSTKKRKCYQCSDCEADLKGCGRCKVAWYCGISCQRTDWKLHKTECHRLKMESMVTKIVRLQDVQKEPILKDIESDGYSILLHANGHGIGLLLRDKDTGTLFESITNQNALFASEVP